jgi:hypothetical protein
MALFNALLISYSHIFFVFPADDKVAIDQPSEKALLNKASKGRYSHSLTDRLGTFDPSFASFDRHIFEQKGVVISCVDGESLVKTLNG